MNIFSALKGTTEEVKLNPNIGTFSWILHRITGLLLLVYLLLHLYVIGSATRGPEAFNQTLGFVQQPLFHFLEIGLILVVFYHMVNGISISIMDFADISRKHKTMVVITVAVFAIIAIVALGVMVPRVIGHHPTPGGNL